MVLDSPFADLSVLAQELVENARRGGLLAPDFIVNLVIKSIRSSILKKAGFDIDTLKPEGIVGQLEIPVLFIHAEEDKVIDSSHRYGVIFIVIVLSLLFYLLYLSFISFVFYLFECDSIPS